MENRDTIKVLQKTLVLLEYLCSESGEIGVREASRRFDIPKSTTQRIMNTLLEAEMVEFNERTQSYSLGNGILKFMSPYVNKNSLIALAKADMDKLRDELGETIGLHSQVDGMQILAHQSESNRELKWSLEVGKMYPLNSGASGKTLLAYMSEKQFEKAKSRFDKVTDKTPDEEKLLQELEKIRKLGYSVSRGEFSPGEMGIAVPIFKGDKLVASLSLYGPEQRVAMLDEQYVVRRLKEKSKKISTRLY